MARMLTVVTPGHRAPGYQFTARDYVAVPAISVHGTWPLWQSMTLTADPRLQSETDAQAVIRMMTQSFDRMRSTK